MRAWWWVLDVLFPQACSGCGVTGNVLCAKCRHAIMKRGSEFLCEGFPVHVACGGGSILRSVVHQFKYRYCEELACELSERLVERLRYTDMSDVWIVPVPLFWKRERERGFNQSTMLAGIVSERLGVKCVELLKRHRETAVQALLNKSERAKNVRGAFVVSTDWVRADRVSDGAKPSARLPRRIFILDDVITSGATFLECARVLRATGVKEVYGIMLSHGL